MYLVTYSCIKLWNYLDILNMYQKIWRYQKYKTSYTYVWVKSFLFTCKRLKVHITSTSWAMVHQSEWILSACSGQSTLGGASGFQGGLEFWIILFSLQTLAALYCIMIIRSHIKDNIAVPWAIKNSKNACQTPRGHFWPPPLKSWWIDKVNIFLHEGFKNRLFSSHKERRDLKLCSWEKGHQKWYFKLWSTENGPF